jgi:phage shock protein A
MLIKADAHGAIESIEDRRLLAKQFVREAKLSLESKRAHIAELEENQHKLTLEGKRLAVLMERINQDVELAVRDGKDDLARAAIRRLLPLREAERRLLARIATLRDEQSRLTQRLALQEQEFEILTTRLQAELATFELRGQPADSFDNPIITDDDVELELLRRRRGTRSAGGVAAEETK